MDKVVGQRHIREVTEETKDGEVLEWLQQSLSVYLINCIEIIMSRMLQACLKLWPSATPTQHTNSTTQSTALQLPPSTLPGACTGEDSNPMSRSPWWLGPGWT